MMYLYALSLYIAIHVFCIGIAIPVVNWLDKLDEQPQQYNEPKQFLE